MLIKKIVSVILSLSLVFMVSGCHSDKDNPFRQFTETSLYYFSFFILSVYSLSPARLRCVCGRPAPACGAASL